MQVSQALDTARIVGARLVRGDIEGIRRLARVNTLFHPDRIVWNFTHLDQLFDALPLSGAQSDSSPLPQKPRDIREDFEGDGVLPTLADHFRARNITSFLVIQNGAIRYERYFQDTTEEDVRISWSMSKSVTSMLLGRLIDLGKIDESALDAVVSDIAPILRRSGYDGVTLRQVLHMSSGVEFNEDYLDYNSDINRLGRVIGVGGSMDAFAASMTRKWAPGTYMHYVSVDTHVVGMAIRGLTGEKMIDLLSEHLVAPMGLEHRAHILVDQEAEPFVLGGLNLSTRDYARFGMMMLNSGCWNGQQILSEDWVETSTADAAPPPSPEAVGTPDEDLRYGMQWWRPAHALDGEFFGVGIYGQYIYIHRPGDTVIVQTGGDVNFRDGNGAVNAATLRMFRQIAEG